MVHIYFMQGIDWLLHILARWDYTIISFLAVLIGMFIWGYRGSLRLAKQAKGAFRNASEVIKNHAPDAKTHGQFYDHYDIIGEEIQRIPMMEHVWHEFSESTFPDEPNKQICLSVRPNTYFNKHAALSIKGNIKQIQAFPNYLIGVGLFFTFLGLASALSIAQAGLGSADQSQQALQDLLKTASVKFISSLVAIALSLLLSVLQRRWFHQCGTSVYGFCCLIEERTEFLPSEKLLMRTLDVQHKQLVAQESMAFNISEKLGEMLAKSLPDSVIQGLSPLTNEITELSKEMKNIANGMKEIAKQSKEVDKDALHKVLQEFLKQLKGSTGSDMDALVASIQTLKDGLEVLVRNIQGMGANFGEDTRQSSALLTSTLHNFVEAFQPVQEGMAHFGATLGALERISMQIDQAGGSIHGAATTNAESVAHLAQTVTGVSDHIMPLKEAMTHLQASLQVVADTSHMMQQAGRTIGEAARGFHDSADKMGNSLQHFTKTADSISHTATILDQASAHVSNAASPLARASDGVTQVASAIMQTETRMREGQSILHHMLEQIQAAEHNIPRILQEYEQRFGKVDEDLSNAFTQMNEGSQSFQAAMAKVVKELDNSFEKALATLAAKIEELADAADFKNTKNGA
ncbi:MAG: hypothetical protein EAY65_03115 [Alphaproteobacteria bacterium]|nr:MAG: hypothetical protein EAY65_03115 [Alphaproteobacteria bacterium]